MREEIPVSVLRDLLDYDPLTGKLWWKPRPAGLFTPNWNKTAEQLANWWNHRFAGKEAFTAAGVENCRTGRIFGTSYYAHRVAWALHVGFWPSHEIDHENGDRSNNRFSNFRAATHLQNMQNKKRYRSNKSGYPGVAFVKRTGRWQAFIGGTGGRTHLGTFDNRDAAIAARKAAEAEHRYHLNHGRAA